MFLLKMGHMTVFSPHMFNLKLARPFLYQAPQAEFSNRVKELALLGHNLKIFVFAQENMKL